MNENPKIHPFFSQYKTYDKYSQVLILGSFPSANSEKYGFYYGDNKNRFWSVLGEVLGESKLKEMSISDKIEFLHKNLSPFGTFGLNATKQNQVMQIRVLIARKAKGQI